MFTKQETSETYERLPFADETWQGKGWGQPLSRGHVITTGQMYEPS